ncbi:hypothetical protein LOTGIDRAFT_229007 [Lottia gigantea]|uniref:Uncharacterized protein n=1 Tax=Lottia gigantea TaxID=225164 RepID=V4A2C0_LOTGI|nr:hypothetical protein LOTGIDRAFT_229007 [Lottia gigantea]ESO89080.1 hypothetical protein LOTGIDRAFT_229007 [Lottia gigantea]
MGKDKKPGILGFQTKDALKNENIKLTSELKSRQAQYKEIYSLVETLNREYVQSKANVPMVRYNQLKDMIKKLIDKKVIQKVRDLADHSQEAQASGTKALVPKDHAHAKEGQPEVQTIGHGIGGLLQRCKEFAGDADDIELKAKKERDLNTLSKQEVTENNDKKRSELQELNAKFTRFSNHLESLQKGYEDSKKLPFTTRYGKMKELVKLVINDSTL